VNLSAEQPEGEEIGPAFQAAGGVIVSVLKAHPSTQKNRLLSLRLPRAICPTGDSHLAHSGIRMLPPTRVAIVGRYSQHRSTAMAGHAPWVAGVPILFCQAAASYRSRNAV
jgi:hypothetical protein